MSSRPRDLPDDDVGEFGSEREREHARIVAALEADPPVAVPAEGRLAHLADRFGLDRFETDLVGLLWCCAFDPALRTAIVQSEWCVGQLTVHLAAQLLGHPLRARLRSGSPLLNWRIVREHELVDGGAMPTIEAAILAWLDGDHELDRLLVGRANLLEPGAELQSWPTDAVAANIRAVLGEGRRLRLWIQSEDRLAVEWFSAALGRRLQLPILAVHQDASAPPAEFAAALHRQAFLDGCALLFDVGSVALAEPAGLPPFPLQVIHGNRPSPTYRSDTTDIELCLGPPGSAEREQLWRRLWPPSATWPRHRLADLALCHEAGVCDIAAVAATCPASVDAAGLSLRQRMRSDCGSMARPIDAGFRWDDLVVAQRTADRLAEIAFEARDRLRLWSEAKATKLFPYGRGLVALFAGPPGTGKTMAAQVIAADLGLDLLSVDISQCISKWVGETAQNLQRLIMSRAAQRSILFFDEADALFAKRVEELRDAQDRFANYDSSFLMTALENHSGVVILATNLKANIDSAFLRRIRHLVDFERPDATAREAIWRQAVDALFEPAQARRLRPQLHCVAAIEATGALIKNAALSASFTARRTGQRASARLLAEMLARELGKDGGGLSERELDALLDQHA